MKLSLPILACLATCNAWSFTGHELIARVAEDLLSPSAAAQISTVLDGRPLSSIAAWADTIKWQQRYKFTSELHYINFEHDEPPRACHFQWHAPGGQEVIAAIHNYTGILRHAEDGTWQQSEALRFLVHYLEDMHQPLHLSGKARGGNDVYVHFDGYKTNLHKVWDGLGLMKRMKTVSKEKSPTRGQWPAGHADDENFNADEDSVHELMSTYHQHIKELMQGRYYGSVSRKWTMCPHTSLEPRFGCPESWAKDIAELNCQYTWLDVTENGTLSEEYWRRIEDDKIFEILVMKAATRLAAVLNSVAEYRTEHHDGV